MNMYSLRDFTEYTGQSLTGESVVLVWSKKTGYFFSQMGFLSDFDCVKLISIKEKM